MSLAVVIVWSLIAGALPAWSATHDDIPNCGLSGVYKTRQTVIQSPNYPNNYPVSTCWDYVIRSPYRCPTKFHIQFLDFYLEQSFNCTNDYLAIGLDNEQDDMDTLCGQVIGIRKYHTEDGALRLRFLTDSSPWTTGRGFKLLVTRLACERENLLRDNLDPTDEDTVEVNAPTVELNQSQSNAEKQNDLFQNLNLQDQHKPFLVPPVFDWNQQTFGYPTPPAPFGGGLYIPASPRPPASQTDKEKPCTTNESQDDKSPFSVPLFPGYLPEQQIPALVQNGPTNGWNPQNQFFFRNSNNVQTRQQIDPQQISNLLEPEQCCSSAFRQKRFYLSSPGFPRTVLTSLLPTQQRDCQFFLEKSEMNICRLRIEFKFFDFGQGYSDNGVKQSDINVITSRDLCTEDYIEIDGQRFCGCRTGYVHNVVWGYGRKVLRMRMGYSGIASSGFLLDISQHECQTSDFVTQLPGQSSVFQQNGLSANFIPQQGNVLQFGNNFAQGFPGQIPQNTLPLQQNLFAQQLPQQQHQQQQQQQQQQPQAGGFQQPFAPFPQQQLPGYYRQPLLQQQPYIPPVHFSGNQNQFGYQVPQFRRARSGQHKPVSVVETNSTRKEYYYFDGDEILARSNPVNEPDDPDRASLRAFNVAKNRCTLDMADFFRLSVDSYWLTKPTCYAPQRRWFSNFFG